MHLCALHSLCERIVGGLLQSRESAQWSLQQELQDYPHQGCPSQVDELSPEGPLQLVAAVQLKMSLRYTKVIERGNLF